MFAKLRGFLKVLSIKQKFLETFESHNADIEWLPLPIK